MKVDEYIRLALYEIWHNKLRTFLTLIGIVIGIAAVIIVTFLVQGAETFVLDEFKKITPLDIISIYPRYNSNTHRVMAKLSWDDIDLIKEKEGDKIKAIAPRMRDNTNIRYRGRKQASRVISTTPYFYDIYRLQLAKGRFLSASDVDGLREVVVLGSKTATELFKNDNPVGKRLFLYGRSFTVIGVLGKRDKSILGGSLGKNNRVFIPISVSERSLNSRYGFSLILQLQDSSLIKSEVARIKNLLNRRYGLSNRGRSKFYISDFGGRFKKRIDIIRLVLVILLGGVASITLLVAGIGVMNIMLVIVTERTKEIGLRKAIGATKKDLLAQFIIEAIILCLVGGVVGVICGYLGTQFIEDIANRFINIKLILSSWSIIISLIFTTTVGIFFGFYPAWKAASLDPIEALRYE